MDLPEPARPEYSVHERSRRRWQLWVTFFLFFAFYSVLHKLLIPLGLKFTSLADSPYAKIDYKFIYAIVLWASLRRANGPTPWVAGLLGAGVVYAIFECYAVYSGYLVGWSAVSKLLSSVPIAIGCGIQLSHQSFKMFHRFAWVGAVAASLFLWGILW